MPPTHCALVAILLAACSSSTRSEAPAVFYDVASREYLGLMINGDA